MNASLNTFKQKVISISTLATTVLVLAFSPSAQAVRSPANFSKLDQTKWTLVSRRCEGAQYKVMGIDSDWTNTLSFSKKNFVSNIERTGTRGDSLLPVGYTERISGVIAFKNEQMTFVPLVRRTLLNSLSQSQDFGVETPKSSQVFPTAWSVRVLMDDDGEWMYAYETQKEGQCTQVMQVFKRVYK